MADYMLVEKKDHNRNQFKVTITGDYNDADYSTRTEYFSKKDFDENVYAEVKDLEENYSGRHELEDFNSDWLWIPSGNDMQCHTLDELTVEYIDEDGKVWDVIL
ncbi:hypothetical protein PQE72_gp158 [Bacillus phage vB_BanS_Skywalker]|uniref:Uncharacterized protein n=2 Tax=Tsamsavirus TaxID=3044849 RepID=A0AAE9CE05_9CAUD|nr:hypothetical protein PQE72_gp158 [Bacillus phage vB_BanS_Skywalker]YP_010681036.1 hypothetical protein PQE73_gp140 [Bacillus phage vB_BanS_MrDarsey]UGO47972.1 hypothetical protein MRDARSEY_140 [Bacillus phage vB_BanS_MrDarsey]UGO51285.1 hypothetical protein SKYWALKER_128 [Bacillus phage vB_BanS_Skywalker]